MNYYGKKDPSWSRSGVFIVNFEHISHFFSSASIDDVKQVNVSWDFGRTKIRDKFF